MKALVKIALLSAVALTFAGIAHAEHRDYRIALANQDKYGHPVYDETAAKPEEAPQIKDKPYNVYASDVDTQNGRDYKIAIVNSGRAKN